MCLQMFYLYASVFNKSFKKQWVSSLFKNCQRRFSAHLLQIILPFSQTLLTITRVQTPLQIPVIVPRLQCNTAISIAPKTTTSQLSLCHMLVCSVSQLSHAVMICLIGVCVELLLLLAADPSSASYTCCLARGRVTVLCEPRFTRRSNGVSKRPNVAGDFSASPHHSCPLLHCVFASAPCLCLSAGST